MPFELPASRIETLTIHVGCALAYEAATKSQIHLLVRPSPEFENCLSAESLWHDRGEAFQYLTDSHGNTVLRTCLLPGLNVIRHSAILQMPERAGPHRRAQQPDPLLPYDAVRYTLPSRYCESDKLVTLATKLFASASNPWGVVQDICDWTHRNIEYRYGSGNSSLSATETISRGYGVCRDFAHVMIALCRALDIPARYAAGHIPLIGNAMPDSDIGIDFHAYVEVYIQGQWHVFDPRHNCTDHLYIKLAHGMDAVDTAIATFHGPVQPAGFDVWAHASSLPAVSRATFATPDPDTWSVQTITGVGPKAGKSTWTDREYEIETVLIQGREISAFDREFLATTGATDAAPARGESKIWIGVSNEAGELYRAIGVGNAAAFAALLERLYTLQWQVELVDPTLADDFHAIVSRQERATKNGRSCR